MVRESALFNILSLGLKVLWLGGTDFISMGNNTIKFQKFTLKTNTRCLVLRDVVTLFSEIAKPFDLEFLPLWEVQLFATLQQPVVGLLPAAQLTQQVVLLKCA